MLNPSRMRPLIFEGPRLVRPQANLLISACREISAKKSHPQDPMFSRRILFAGLTAFVGAGVIAGFHSQQARCEEVKTGGLAGLDSKNFVSFKLKKKTQYNHNTAVYIFETPVKETLDLPVASCILTKAKIGDEDVIRPYTPIDSHTAGELHLMVKEYAQGKMSKHIASLKEGETLEFKGPISKIPYEPNRNKRIVMLAGGTGVTPMLQVIHKILNNPQDQTEVTLLFANVTEKDILLREHLDDLTKTHSNLKVVHVLERASPTWSGHSGFINKDLLKKYVGSPQEAERLNQMIYVCGPPGFMNALSGEKNMKDKTQGELKGALKELGFSETQVFKF